MTRIFASIVALTLAVAAPAFGHEEFRVVGEITQSKAALIEVKTRDGKVAAVHLDGQTNITKDKVKTDATAKQIEALTQRVKELEEQVAKQNE